jgi:hypothetical protein
MKNRKAFELDSALTIWNFAFSFFSLIATIRLLPELIWAVGNLGFVGRILDPRLGYVHEILLSELASKILLRKFVLLYVNM